MLNQDDQFDEDLYMRRVKEILKPKYSYEFDLAATLFGAALITVPFVLIYTRHVSNKVQEKASDAIISRTTTNVAKHNFIADKAKYVCTDQYGRDNDGLILNSAGLPKNPQTADDIPLSNITDDRLIPSIIDQHNTCGIQV